MASYLKPQSPILYKENYIYPLTTYDQIIMPDGSRWQGEVSSGDYTETDPTVPAWAKESNPPTYTKNDVGLGNVDNVKQYSADNPPPYPVTSVNGQIGAVTVETGNALDPYPIGAIYISTSSTSPASLFGGTWEQIEDRFLLAAGTSYTAGSTGGAATHTLTANQMPTHVHRLTFNMTDGDASSVTVPQWTSYMNATWSTIGETWEVGQTINKQTLPAMETAGGGQAHNNMPPYLTVYMWRRVA